MLKKVVVSCLFVVACGSTPEAASNDQISDENSQVIAPIINSQPQQKGWDNNYITFDVMPSPKGLNWETPRNLLNTLVVNTASGAFGRDHSIGHVFIELSCGFKNQSPVIDIKTGMTSNDDLSPSDKDLLLKHKIGLGVMFYDYVGQLDSYSTVETEVYNRANRSSYNSAPGKIYQLKMKISETTCVRLAEYEKQYEAQEKIDYGLANDPLAGEGAGCAVFAGSFMEVGGLDFNYYQSLFTRQFFVPNKYIGYTGIPGYQDREVRVVSVYTQAKWGDSSDQNHSPISFWDPDLMSDYIKGQYDQALSAQGSTSRYQTYQFGQFGEGIEIDASQLKTPSGEIFSRRQ